MKKGTEQCRFRRFLEFGISSGDEAVTDRFYSAQLCSGGL
jgi:hypothetical protein